MTVLMPKKIHKCHVPYDMTDAQRQYDEDISHMTTLMPLKVQRCYIYYVLTKAFVLSSYSVQKAYLGIKQGALSTNRRGYDNYV